MKIQLKDFGKQYGKKVLYKNQNIHIEIEDVICLVGESGVGKTTLCNIFLGFENEYEGEYIIDSGAEKIKFSIMPQSNKLLDYATVYENVLVFSEEKK